ncbi:MAG: proline racemase family protein [Cytophagales bacterium]|nr:proline racemase family protein [Cytophagales bacterium]
MKNCYGKTIESNKLQAPENWHKIQCIDMHTGGEPLRVVTGGFPEILGNGVLEKRIYVKDNHDDLRRALMWEPRGHADMYGCLITEPNDEHAHFGVIFIHNEGYSTMCGHAIIALGKLAVEMGWVEQTGEETEIIIDAPCGRIFAYSKTNGRTVVRTRFHCVTSFVVSLDEIVEVKGLGKVKYDLAFGGAFYAYVDADLLGLNLDAKNYAGIIKAGRKIKEAVIAGSDKVKHPFEADLSYLYGTIFISHRSSAKADSKNVCVFADGEVDRSPTGSGVSGRMAVHHARKEIKIGEKMKIESIVGSVFTGSVVKEVDFGPFKAVIPEVEGNAFITGQHTFFIDPEDPFRKGFFLR